MDNGIYSKDNFVYDEEGRLIEQTTLYYKFPDDNVVIKFTYNSKGEKTSEKSFDLDGKLLFVSLLKYNEQGEIISFRSGSDMEYLYEQIYVYDGSEENQTVYESSEVYIEETDDQRILNDNGQVIYDEYDYENLKMTYEYSYYDNGIIKKEQRKIITDDRSNLSISYYNDKGELISNERSDKFKNYGECSYRTEYTYNKQGYKASSVDILLGGECPSFIDEVKREFKYDDKGNLVNVHSVLDGDAKNGYTTMKVEKFYTNELEEF